MVDRETRKKILSDKSLPIHRPYDGGNSRMEVLDLLLRGYGIKEIYEEWGIPRSTAASAVSRIKLATGKRGVSTSKLLRDLVKKHRGYL